MRVFIAGATGTLGLPLVQQLINRGDHVIGLTRKEAGRDTLQRLGADAVIGDALDRERLQRLVVDAAPTHVVHLLTALPKAGVMKASDLTATNELRVRGTPNLLEAAIAAGARRIVVESYPSVYGAGHASNSPLAEDAPFAPLPTGPIRETVAALREMEAQVLAASDRIDTIILRYGNFYGDAVPSTVAMAAALRARKVPLMRGATGVGSFLHIDDAVAATIAALDRGKPGSIYNIVDDEPVAITEFIKHAANAAGAPRPFTFPRFLVKLLAPMAVEFSTARLPLSNAKAKRELGFTPRFKTYRDGLCEVAAATTRRRSPTS